MSSSQFPKQKISQLQTDLWQKEWWSKPSSSFKFQTNFHVKCHPLSPEHFVDTKKKEKKKGNQVWKWNGLPEVKQCCGQEDPSRLYRFPLHLQWNNKYLQVHSFITQISWQIQLTQQWKASDTDKSLEGWCFLFGFLCNKYRNNERWPIQINSTATMLPPPTPTPTGLRLY